MFQYQYWDIFNFFLFQQTFPTKRVAATDAETLFTTKNLIKVNEMVQVVKKGTSILILGMILKIIFNRPADFERKQGTGADLEPPCFVGGAGRSCPPRRV